MLRVALILVALCAIAPIAAPAHAEPRPLGESLERVYATNSEGLRLLRDNGGVLQGVATLERVRDGYVVELRVAWQQVVARYPVKLARDDDVWRLVWQPDAAYAAALVALVTHRGVVDVASDDVWSDTARLPALPVIVTRQRIVTPFGELPTPSGGEALEALEGLQRATRAWIVDVLDEDPAPAGVDLLLDPALSWSQLNSVLFNLAAAGLFQATVVTANGGALLLAAPARQAPTIVAVFPLDAAFAPLQWGVRLVVDEVAVGSSDCAPQMTGCIAAHDELPALLPAEARGPLMLAAPASPTVAEVLRFVPVLKSYAAIAPHRLLLGYIAP